MSSIDVDEIFQQVKANSAKLDSCALHDFSIPVDRRTKQVLDKPDLFCRWRCSKCLGEVDGIVRRWYRLGLEHGKRVEESVTVKSE
jgi:hypothetical protein